MTSDYILEVGEQGKNRLGMLNEFLNPLSQRFLIDVGLSEGMHVLEAGCGIGIMTAWLAQSVGPQGKVTALDNSQEQIAVARETVEAAGLTNVEFLCASIQGADLPRDHYDFTFCRLLLIHLGNPRDGLKNFMRAIRSNGIVACEEQIITGFQTYPDTDLWQRVAGLYKALSEKNGVDANYGLRLGIEMGEVGLTPVSRSFSEAVIGRDDALAYCLMILAEMKPALLANGLISESDYAELEDEINSEKYADIEYSTFLKMAQIAGVK